jgi:hypothetical protein
MVFAQNRIAYIYGLLACSSLLISVCEKLPSGQAVVLHRLTIMSKDGDWILRQNRETMEHVLTVLSNYNARYRFGAPFDIRWLSYGWSSHFEFKYKKLRVRTDFAIRPPRISKDKLQQILKEQGKKEIPFIGIRPLAEIKKTNLEKDYVVIGELARMMSSPADQLLYSRSALDIIDLAQAHSDLIQLLSHKRPLLRFIPDGCEKLEYALDKERRDLIHKNEKLLMKYMKAAEGWAKAWKDVEKKIFKLSLIEAHAVIVNRALGVLPVNPDEG